MALASKFWLNDLKRTLLRDRLQIFVSYSYRELVALYDIDTIFYELHTS